MAKQKAKVQLYTHPKEAPEGTEFVSVKRAVGKNKNVVIKTLVPTADAAGATKGITWLDSILPEGSDGRMALVHAVRNWIVTSQIAQYTGLEEGGDTSEVGRTVPRVSTLTVVDKAVVFGASISQYINDHPSTPTADELAAETKRIYAGLAL